jgi:tellurite resistance protein TehA-like permease
MTEFGTDPATLAARLRRVALLILGLGAGGFILGVVLHVADQAGAGGWMIASFAALTFGTGILAVAHRARIEALLNGSSTSVAAHRTDAGRGGRGR